MLAQHTLTVALRMALWHWRFVRAPPARGPESHTLIAGQCIHSAKVHPYLDEDDGAPSMKGTTELVVNEDQLKTKTGFD